MRRKDITAIVLCGGRGARLGSVAKPLTSVGGHRLVDHVIAALHPQVGDLVLSCGADAAPYEGLGYPTVVDIRPGDGPLGGIVSSLLAVKTDWVLTHPGDAPFAHPALASRLTPAAETSGIAVPRTGDYRQNLVLLMSRSMAETLERFYRGGGRAVKDWLDEQRVESTDMTDVADSFFNVNTADDLEAAEQRLARRS